VRCFTPLDVQSQGKRIYFVRGQLTIFQNIILRKRREERIRQPQKMESAGRLAAGIAHDFNSILAFLLAPLTGYPTRLHGLRPSDYLDMAKR